MSIIVSKGDTRVIVITDDNSWKQFQELVQRAANLWPDAHPEIKLFADQITEGKEQQDYQKQEYYISTPREQYTYYHKCPLCLGVTGFQTISPKPPSYKVKCEKLVTIDNPNKEEGSPPQISIACGKMAPFNQYISGE